MKKHKKSQRKLNPIGLLLTAIIVAGGWYLGNIQTSRFQTYTAIDKSYSFKYPTGLRVNTDNEQTHNIYVGTDLDSQGRFEKIIMDMTLLSGDYDDEVSLSIASTVNPKTKEVPGGIRISGDKRKGQGKNFSTEPFNEYIFRYKGGVLKLFHPYGISNSETETFLRMADSFRVND